MANPYPLALRERAVRAYETSTDTYREVADRFEIHFNTLVRWVQRGRDRGDLLPSARGGGWRSPVQIDVVHRLVAERPDRTTDELTRAYNAAVEAPARVHRSSILRALQRTGYVFKKNGPARSSKIVRASKRSGAPSAGGSLA
jgi:transposase